MVILMILMMPWVAGGSKDVDDDGDEGYDDAQGDCLVGGPWLAAW